ncbi:MAG TPA: hypothetical protein PKK94_20555 [Leptospiraceae bacterium]|nr:hypothetical protein [Leptospiraceae bacterium]
MKYYKLQNPGIDQTPFLDSKCDWFGKMYSEETGGQILIVSSGRRNAASQAKAMFENYKNEVTKNAAPISYRLKQAEQEIRESFMNGFKTLKKPDAEIIKDMTAVINSQIQREILISNHLPTKNNADGTANDFSLQNDYAVMDAICKEYGIYIIKEPKCIHITWPA